MNDQEIIAHQARKIVELEVQVAELRRAEEQLLYHLESAGITLKQVEVTQREAEFLRNYRNASPEGKALIRAKVQQAADAMGQLAADAVINKASGASTPDQGPAPSVPQVKGETKVRKVTQKDQQDLSGLPAAFFKPPKTEDAES